MQRGVLPHPDAAWNTSFLQADFESVSAQHQPLRRRLRREVAHRVRRVHEGELRAESGFDGTHPAPLPIAARDDRLPREEGERARGDFDVAEERRVGRVSIETHPLRNDPKTVLRCRRRDHPLQGHVAGGDLELHRGGDPDEVVAPELHRVT